MTKLAKKTGPLKACIYTRVSTVGQTTENQKRELVEVAKKRGWDVVDEYTDQGISGGKGREARPGLNAMLKAADAGEFDIILVWAIDRLGRSLVNLIHTLQDLDSAKVGLYLHNQNIDTTTPSGRALFQMLGVFAEFERSMIQTRIKAGLARVKEEGRRPGPKGIEHSDPERYRRVVELLANGTRPWVVHKTTGTGHSTVLRIRDELRAAAE
ncbi:MAG TPA: recombinase family protein [Candidatus Eisenbacteria bacterium]|nr:recombinase family protein [Candidatus Eisenbacteria bacterium]